MHGFTAFAGEQSLSTIQLDNPSLSRSARFFSLGRLLLAKMHARMNITEPLLQFMSQCQNFNHSLMLILTLVEYIAIDGPNINRAVSEICLKIILVQSHSLWLAHQWSLRQWCIEVGAFLAVCSVIWFLVRHAPRCRSEGKIQGLAALLAYVLRGVQDMNQFLVFSLTILECGAVSMLSRGGVPMVFVMKLAVVFSNASWLARVWKVSIPAVVIAAGTVAVGMLLMLVPSTGDEAVLLKPG